MSSFVFFFFSSPFLLFLFLSCLSLCTHHIVAQSVAQITRFCVCCLFVLSSSSVSRCIFSYTPEPQLHHAPFLSTHFFPCSFPTFKNGSFLSVVALMSVTLLDSNPRSAEKRSILGTDSLLLLPRGQRQLTFPNVKNDAGQKQHSPCF